jgi:ATP-dependent RNA helicase SUPV3L1/SUV3
VTQACFPQTPISPAGRPDRRRLLGAHLGRARRAHARVAGRQPDARADAGGVQGAQRPRQGRGPCLREKLDEIRRAKGQEAIAAEWADKAQALLDLPQAEHRRCHGLAARRRQGRRAAVARAAGRLKTQLAERVRCIEDLQHRVQVQREAAVLLAQRIEVLSTKPWRDAQAAWDVLRTDVAHWQTRPPRCWPTPTGPAWTPSSRRCWTPRARSCWPCGTRSRARWRRRWPPRVTRPRRCRRCPCGPTSCAWARGACRPRPPRRKPAGPRQGGPEVRPRPPKPCSEVLAKLEAEIAEGHGKASAGAATALRNALKEHGKLVDDKLENQAHAALAAAGELEGWQRWRADQLREELVAKAEGLLETPRPRPGQAAPGRAQDAGDAAPCASSGSRPTRAARPTTPCGSALTRPATKPTRWSRPGWTRSRPRRPSTAPSAWR